MTSHDPKRTTICLGLIAHSVPHISGTMQCSADADNTFGPQYCNEFDFTLLFEQTVFQIAPCALLMLTLPLRAFQLRRRKVKTSRDGAWAVKGIALAVLAATQLALLIAWSTIPTFRTKASIPAAILSFMAALSLLYLSSVEHMKSIRPSSTVGVYTLLSCTWKLVTNGGLSYRHTDSTPRKF